MSFEGWVSVITGAGGGIGRSLALELARRGSDVVVQDIDAATAEAVAAEVRALGRRAMVRVFDVADRDAMAAFARDVEAELGGAHLLINNAGITVVGHFEDVSLDEWDRIVGVNLWGVVQATHLFLPQLKRADRAHIVNLSSLFGIAAFPTQSAYCATKFAVRGFTESLHLELMDSSVGVTCVHPGAVATRIAADSAYHGAAFAQADAERLIAGGISPDQAAAAILRAVERNQPRVVLGADGRWIDRLARAMPVRYRRLIKWGSDREAWRWGR